MTFNIVGIEHIELTVSNLQKSKEFYEKLPGFKVVAKYVNFIMFYTGSFYLGITDHKGQQKQLLFSEQNVGMDHLAFRVQSKNDLDEAVQFFDKEAIPHGKIEELSNKKWTVVFRDPDNIQLELAFKE